MQVHLKARLVAIFILNGGQVFRASPNEKNEWKNKRDRATTSESLIICTISSYLQSNITLGTPIVKHFHQNKKIDSENDDQFG